MSPVVGATDLDVRLEGAPESGVLIFQVYDAADAFGDLRDPAQEIVVDARGDDEYRLSDLVEGEVAVLVYHDENANGFLDKNFIGIPRETLAISNKLPAQGTAELLPGELRALLGEHAGYRSPDVPRSR